MSAKKIIFDRGAGKHDRLLIENHKQKKMKRIMLVCAIAMFAVSCNKNQKTVKELDGSWEVTSIKYIDEDGTVEEDMEEDVNLTFTFDNCKLKKDEYCTVRIDESYDGFLDSYTNVYRVTDDGETLEIKETATETYVEDFEIKELSKDVLKISDTEDGETFEITFKKK